MAARAKKARSLGVQAGDVFGPLDEARIVLDVDTRRDRAHVYHVATGRRSMICAGRLQYERPRLSEYDSNRMLGKLASRHPAIARMFGLVEEEP